MSENKNKSTLETRKEEALKLIEKWIIEEEKRLETNDVEENDLAKDNEINKISDEESKEN